MNLTKEQILKEPAGEKMDGWVAEYVMGWSRPLKNLGSGIWNLRMNGDYVEYLVHQDTRQRVLFEVFKKDQYWTRDNESLFAPFEYSTKIVWAWDIVEKMRNNYFKWFEMVHRPRGYICNFVGDPKYTILAKEAPLAICRAALLAVLGETE